MNIIALLGLMVLMGTACSSPVHGFRKSDPIHFKHVSDLGDSSVAPWTLKIDTLEGRQPENILHAECSKCTVPDMIPKPIELQIFVHSYDKDTESWKRHPYNLAVGCTCVREQKQ